MNITEIANDLYKLEVPLYKTPLKATNAYFLRGSERDFLIDTGFNHPLSRDALTEALESLNVDMARTDLFITHLHSDHSGLYGHIAKPGSRVFMSRADGEIVAGGRESSFWETFKRFYTFTGLLAGGHVTEVGQHPGYAYAPPPSDRIEYVEDGHEFVVGKRRLRCILTKGHTRGHLCLYEPNEKLLFSGDHILGKITPNITQMSLDHNALGEYLDSLDRIAALDVAVVHPGHRHSIDDCRGRVAELKSHHEKRLAEVLDIIGGDTLNTVAVARRMRWSLTYDNWDEYPPAQKLFSAGEALAHLHYLALRGVLAEDDKDGILFFRKVHF